MATATRYTFKKLQEIGYSETTEKWAFFYKLETNLSAAASTVVDVCILFLIHLVIICISCNFSTLVTDFL